MIINLAPFNIGHEIFCLRNERKATKPEVHSLSFL